MLLQSLASSPRSLAVVLMIAVAPVAGCDGEVTEQDLQKWTHNDIGLARISQLVADPQQPLTTRIRALVVVVEKDFPTRIRAMVDEIDDQRDEIVKGLVTQLLAHVKAKDEHQYKAKDGLLAMQRYISAEDFDEVQSALASWAFDGISWESTEEEVKKGVAARITSGQVADLGAYAYEGGGILISYGFVVDKMLDYLTSAKDVSATAMLLRGIRKHHARLGGVPYHHLEAIARTNNTDGLNYLLDIYLDKTYADDIRTAAYNFANEMLERPNLDKGKDSAAITAKLLQLMDTDNPLDRWQGALNIVYIDGVNKLEDVLARFKDDKVYSPTDDPPPIRQVMDLCLDIYDGKHAVKAVPVFMKHAQGDNRIVAGISVVCLKANRAHEARPVLEALAKSADAAADVSLADFLGAGYTVGQLAANALDGLTMMKKVDADLSTKAFTEYEGRRKKELISFILHQRGDAYTAQVDKEFKEFQDDFKANPDRYKE